MVNMTGPVDFGALIKDMGAQLEVIPIGEYDCVVKTCDAGSSSNGKPMLKAKFSVESGPQAGRTLYNNFTISAENPTALRIFFTQMKTLGLDPTFFAANPSMEIVAQNLIGKRARLTVGHRLYQGQNQPDIKQVNPPIGGQGAAPVVGGVPGVPSVAAPVTSVPAPTGVPAPAVAPPVVAAPPAAAPPVAPPVAPPAPAVAAPVAPAAPVAQPPAAPPVPAAAPTPEPPAPASAVEAPAVAPAPPAPVAEVPAPPAIPAPPAPAPAPEAAPATPVEQPAPAAAPPVAQAAAVPPPPPSVVF